MAIKKGNVAVTVTLNPWHQKKLQKLMVDTKLTATAVIQRLLEGVIQVKK